MNRWCAGRESHTSMTIHPASVAPAAWLRRPSGQSPTPVAMSMRRCRAIVSYCSWSWPLNSRIKPTGIAPPFAHSAIDSFTHAHVGQVERAVTLMRSRDPIWKPIGWGGCSVAGDACRLGGDVVVEVGEQEAELCEALEPELLFPVALDL